MNIIALEKSKEVLEYLCNGLEDSPDTHAARCEQQKGLEVFGQTARMQSIACMKDNEFHGAYRNSFSRCRSRFDEWERISLTSFERH